MVTWDRYPWMLRKNETEVTWGSRGWFSIPKIENWTVEGPHYSCLPDERQRDENALYSVHTVLCTPP